MAEPVRYLGLKALAERAGISPGTASAYLARGYLPEPDALTEEGSRQARGWLPETVDEWIASRPGRGARTDLRK